MNIKLLFIYSITSLVALKGSVSPDSIITFIRLIGNGEILMVPTVLTDVQRVSKFIWTVHNLNFNFRSSECEIYRAFLASLKPKGGHPAVIAQFATIADGAESYIRIAQSFTTSNYHSPFAKMTDHCFNPNPDEKQFRTYLAVHELLLDKQFQLILQEKGIDREFSKAFKDVLTTWITSKKPFLTIHELRARMDEILSAPLSADYKYLANKKVLKDMERFISLYDTLVRGDVKESIVSLDINTQKYKLFNIKNAQPIWVPPKGSPVVFEQMGISDIVSDKLEKK